MFDYVVYVFYECESFRVLTLFVGNLCSGHFHLLVRLPQFRSVGVEICFAKTCKLEKEELVYFIMLECKIHGVFQETRPVTCVLGLEGIALG
jgi:hypothetical protein